MRKLSKVLAVSMLSMSIATSIGIVSWADSTTENISNTQATFSQYWYQDTAGNWHIKDGNGNMVTNAWLCDDAVQSNGQNVWYLIDSNGNMITQGLVRDQTGNYYSLETNHNGFYGMLRYQSGTYDNINLTLDSNHAGSFAAIQNPEAIQALQSKYGLTEVSINNSNCIYTSQFTQSNHNTPSTSQPQPTNNTSEPQNQPQNTKKDKYTRDDGAPDYERILNDAMAGVPEAQEKMKDVAGWGAEGNHNWN